MSKKVILASPLFPGVKLVKTASGLTLEIELYKVVSKVEKDTNVQVGLEIKSYKETFDLSEYSSDDKEVRRALDETIKGKLAEIEESKVATERKLKEIMDLNKKFLENAKTSILAVKNSAKKVSE